MPRSPPAKATKSVHHLGLSLEPEPTAIMYMAPNYYPLVLDRMRLDNYAFLASAVVSFAAGYVQYVYAICLPITQGGKSAMPFWMHAFYLAHDSTFSYVLGKAAGRYDGHWFLTGTSYAFALWSALEIWCMHRSLTTDRHAVFSDLFGPNPPLGPVLQYAVAQQAGFYSLIVLGLLLFGEGGFMQWFCVTNVLIAVGPLHLYVRRGSRQGLSVWLCLANILAVALTFAPFGMWVIVLPEVFDNREYYMVGVVLVGYSTWCLSIVARYDAKPHKLRQ